jgi:hypothetical protein
MRRFIWLLVVLFVGCMAPAQAPEAPTYAPVTEQPSTATLVAEGGAGGAQADDSVSAGRFGFVPQPCVAFGWKASACVKSPTSSRYYIAVPDGRTFAEKITAIIMPPPLPNQCIPERSRACGGYPYDVCNDGSTDYFYCGNTTRHDAEGYWR